MLSAGLLRGTCCGRFFFSFDPGFCSSSIHLEFYRFHIETRFNALKLYTFMFQNRVWIDLKEFEFCPKLCEEAKFLHTRRKRRIS